MPKSLDAAAPFVSRRILVGGFAGAAFGAFAGCRHTGASSLRDSAPADGAFLATFRSLPYPQNTLFFLQQLTANPRELFRELRSESPIFRAPGVLRFPELPELPGVPEITLATRYQDVREIMLETEIFSTAITGWRAKRLRSETILGMKATPRYFAEQKAMRAAVPAADLGLIRGICREIISTSLEGVRAGDSFDFVQDVARTLPARMLSRYFGLDGMPENDLIAWGHVLSEDIFWNLADDQPVRDQADAAAAALQSHLVRLVATARRGGSARANDVATQTPVQRIAAYRDENGQELDLDTAARLCGAFVVGSVATTSLAASFALNSLFENRTAFMGAKAAAMAQDDAGVAAHAWEALRFFPVNSFFFRTCEKDHVLGRATAWESEVKAGSLVFAANLSAMFDPMGPGLADAEAFRAGRPDEAYFHFSLGRHACFGEHIGRLTVPMMLGATLKRVGLDSRLEPLGMTRAFPSRLRLRMET